MQAKGIKISKLTEATEIREHDVIPIVQDGETKKFKLSNLKINLDDYYTSDEIDEMISDEIEKLKVLTTGVRFNINESDFLAAKGTNLYKATLNHNLNLNLEGYSISFYNNSFESASFDYRIINKNKIEISSDIPCNIIVAIKQCIETKAEEHRHDFSDIDNFEIPEVALSNYYNKQEVDDMYELQNQYHSDINVELGRINKSVSNLNVDIGKINMSVTETNSRIENMDIGSCNFILQSAFIDKSIEYECDGNIEIEGGVATVTNATHFDMDIGSTFGAIKRNSKLSLSAIASSDNSAAIPMNKYIGGNINIFSENYEYINKSIADLNINLITIPVVVSIENATSNEPRIEEWDLNRTKAYLSNLNKDGLIKDDTKLIFEPHPLISYGSVPETDYNPSDKDIFFKNWKKLIIDTLTTLNEYEFYGIYIGTNFQKFDTGEDNINRWSKLCNDLKELYSDCKIIYRTNWWVTATWDDGATQVYRDKLNNPIWGFVDIISISSYFELNDKASPTVDELYDNIMNGTNVYNRGQKVFEEVKSFYDKWNKPIMFGELGCPSKDYGAMNPWSNLTDNPDNEAVQYNVIEAYNRAFVYKNDEYDNSWFLGYSIFALGNTVSEFDIVGKQAQQSIINAIDFIDSNNETGIRCRVINKDNNHTIIDYKLPLSTDMNTVNRVCKKLDFDGHDKAKISFELDRSVTFKLSKPMLVQGEKMVSWSPSPQDSEGYTDNKVTIFNEKIAQLNIKADNINASVQENTVTITENKADADSKITEVNQKMGELDIKADNINASVRENTTTITENKADADSKITSVNERVGQLDIKADSIKASVQENTKIITENKTDADSKITEVNKKVAQLDIKANNINASVQENSTIISENKADVDSKITEVNKKVAQLDIKATSINASVEENTTKITENKADVDSKITETNKKIGQVDIKADNIKASVESNTALITANKTDADNKIVEINKNISAIDVKADNINASVKKNTTAITTNKTELESKITDVSDKFTQLDLKADGINASVQSNTSKITENKSYLDTKVTEINKSISNVDVKANGINSKVSALETKTNTIDGKVTDHGSRLSTAEQKITASAITTTVTSSKTYKDDLSGKVSTNKVVSSINQTSETVKIQANKIQLEGTVTTGTGGRQVRVNNGDYAAIIDGSERMFFGSRDFENNYRVPKFYMGAYGFDTDTHNYFGMTSYRGNGDNPETNTYAYQDLSYRCINSDFRDWSNIKMYSSGRIRVAPVENFEITTNFKDGVYDGTEEKRLALFATSTSSHFNSNLQIGCLRNMSNTNGLILADYYHSGKETRIRVHTDNNGNKFFRPLTEGGDIANGSASFPWKSVSSKSVYSQEGVVNTGARATVEITTDNVLDNLEFIEPLSNSDSNILMDVSKVIDTPYARVEEETVEINNSELLKLALMEIKKLKEEIKILKSYT